MDMHHLICFMSGWFHVGTNVSSAQTQAFGLSMFGDHYINSFFFFVGVFD